MSIFQGSRCWNRLSLCTQNIFLKHHHFPFRMGFDCKTSSYWSKCHSNHWSFGWPRTSDAHHETQLICLWILWPRGKERKYFCRSWLRLLSPSDILSFSTLLQNWHRKLRQENRSFQQRELHRSDRNSTRLRMVSLNGIENLTLKYPFSSYWILFPSLPLIDSEDSLNRLCLKVRSLYSRRSIQIV